MNNNHELSTQHTQMIDLLGLRDKRRLKTYEAIALYGIPESTLRKLAADKILKPYKTETGGWWFFLHEDIKKWMLTGNLPPDEVRLKVAIKEAKILLIRKRGTSILPSNVHRY